MQKITLSDPGTFRVDRVDLRISKFGWLRAFFDRAQLNIYKPPFYILQSITT